MQYFKDSHIGTVGTVRKATFVYSTHVRNMFSKDTASVDRKLIVWKITNLLFFKTARFRSFELGTVTHPYSCSWSAPFMNDPDGEVRVTSTTKGLSFTITTRAANPTARHAFDGGNQRGRHHGFQGELP
jgi:hypothetical protein